MIEACIALGGNLDGPAERVRAGLDALGAHPQIELVSASKLYRTPPVGPPGQPDYVNAAARVRTTLEPLALLDACQEIENAHGRTREGERWGPRTLDLDVLTYGKETLDLPRLTVPHPRIAERAFVLVPLNDIAPELDVPGLGRVVAMLADLPMAEIAGVRLLG